MANTTSAKKKTKVIKKKTSINRIRLGKQRNAILEMENAIKGGDKAKALKLFNVFQSRLMKVSKKVRYGDKPYLEKYQEQLKK